MATHSSILGWEIPWTKEPGGLVHGVAKRIGCNLLTKQQNCYLRLTERKTFWATRWWRQVMGR